MSQYIYGREPKTVSSLAPQRINDLFPKIPSKLGLTLDVLLNEHTALSYYTAFMSKDEKAEFASSWMAGEWDRRPPGIDAMPIGAAVRLRFCLTCLTLQREKLGEAYWRLSHQLPIVTVCHEHRAPLRESVVKSMQSYSTFICPDSDNCPADAPTVLDGIGEDELTILEELGQAACQLLAGRYPSGLGPDWSGADLMRGLRSKGYVAAGNSVRWEDLNHAIEESLPTLLRVFPDMRPSGDNNWLIQLRFEAAPRYTDTILAAKFIVDHVRTREVGFGAGPWPCLNPLSDHHGQRVVMAVKKLRKVNGLLQGRFSCDCGYEYTRGVDNEGNWTKPAVWEFGPSLDSHVEEAVSNGWSLRRTHTGAGVGSETFLRHAERRGIRHPWRKPKPTS